MSAMTNSLAPVLQVTFRTASGPVLHHKMAAKTRPVNNNLPFKILQQVISQTPPFLLVLVSSHLLSTFLIQPKSNRFTRTSDSLPSPAIWLKPPRRPSRTRSTWTLLPLLPMTSLLNDTIHSHLNLKVDDQGLTIHLPFSYKHPQITSIDRWLDAFAIYFAVIVSVCPSHAADLIAYQQLIRDAAQKFPGIAWYVYNVEFWKRASHNLSAKWGERDVQLYLDTFKGLPKWWCWSCGSTDYLSDTCSLSPRRSQDALTNTGVTSWDAQQLTLGKITLNSPAKERTDLSRLQAPAIPPEDTPNYLSQLTPPTPIDNFASYLQGH